MKTSRWFHDVSTVLALAAFCAGYLTNRTLAPAGGSSKSRPAIPGRVEATVRMPGFSKEEEDLRKGQVLSTLLDASRQFDDTARRPALELAAAEIGPLEIEAALDLAYRMPYDARHDLIPILVARWAELDPKAAAEYSLKPRPVHFNGTNDLLAEAMVAWAKQDYAAGKAWAMSLENPVKRRQALSGLIEGIAHTDPARAIAMVEESATEFQVFNTSRIMAAIAATNPGMVAEYIQRDAARSRYSMLIDRLLWDWPAKDLENALAWTSRLATPRARESARTTLFSVRFQENPAFVADSILRLPHGAERHRIVSAISRTGAESNPGKIVELAMSFPQGSERKSMIGTALESWSRKDPGEAMATVQSWTPEICSEAEKGAYETKVLWFWVHSDRAAALEWAEHFGPGEKRDACFETAAASAMTSDAKAGLEIAERIQDPVRRESTMRKSYEQWGQRDARAAANWLEASNVPVDWKAAWRSPPDASKTK